MEEDRSVFEIDLAHPTKSISFGSEEDQVIDLFLPPAGKKTLIILIHGGYWRPEYDRKHLSPFAKALSENGWPVALIEYRRIIGNPDAAISDVKSSIQLLAKDFREIILVGHSAGGHLALVTAPEFNVKAVIAMAPLSDLQRCEELDLDEGAVSDFLGTPARMREDIDPMKLPALEIPTLLIHGALDIRVPISFSREYVSKKANKYKRLLEFEDIGHFELIDPRHEKFMKIFQELLALD